MIAERQQDTMAPQFAAPERSGLRLGAALAAIPIGLFVVVLATAGLLLVAHLAQVPDAYDSNREYGGAPDTWTGTFENVLWSIGILAVVMVSVTGMVGLIHFAATGRSLSRRAWIRMPAALTGSVVTLMLGSLLLSSAAAQTLTNCREFQFDRAAFTSSDELRWRPQARALEDCDLLRDLNRAQIEAKLGPDEEDEYSSLRYHDMALVIDFKEDDVDGRPSSVLAW